MSIVALQKLLHILSNKMTAQFYMSVRSEQDGCRSYVPSICSCQNTDHAQLGLPYLMSNYRHLTGSFFCFLIFKDPGNLRKGLDKKVKSSQDLDESFSTLSRLGWVIFNSLQTWMSHFQKSSRLGWGLTSLFGFLNSKGFRKLKENTELKGAQAGSWRETRLD
jgi:hypothetical protein